MAIITQVADMCKESRPRPDVGLGEQVRWRRLFVCVRIRKSVGRTVATCWLGKGEAPTSLSAGTSKVPVLVA